MEKINKKGTLVRRIVLFKNVITNPVYRYSPGDELSVSHHVIVTDKPNQFSINDYCIENLPPLQFFVLAIAKNCTTDSHYKDDYWRIIKVKQDSSLT